LLSGFFRAQLPAPWPAWTPPGVLPPPAASQPGRRALSRSRLALAASVAILFSGQLWLQHVYQADEPAPGGAAPVDIASPPGKHDQRPKGEAELKSSTKDLPHSLPSRPR
jgi:hypothetical protein